MRIRQGEVEAKLPLLCAVLLTDSPNVGTLPLSTYYETVNAVDDVVRDRSKVGSDRVSVQNMTGHAIRIESGWLIGRFNLSV